MTVGGRVCLGERVVVRGGVLSFQARVTGEDTSSSPTSIESWPPRRLAFD